MTSTEQYARQVSDEVIATFRPKSEWAAWPGGWPGDIESALVDSIFSARARYKTAGGRGIHQQVVSWQETRPKEPWTVKRLAGEFAGAEPSTWAAKFKNSQHSPRRPATAPGGATKAATVLEATQRLTDIDINDHTDVTLVNAAEARRALRKVPGIGYATANYFTMLLGIPGVKPDRMVHRFLHNVRAQSFSDADAEAIVTQAARNLGVGAHELEHAIWKRESDLAASASKPRR